MLDIFICGFVCRLARPVSILDKHVSLRNAIAEYEWVATTSRISSWHSLPGCFFSFRFIRHLHWNTCAPCQQALDVGVQTLLLWNRSHVTFATLYSHFWMSLWLQLCRKLLTKGRQSCFETTSNQNVVQGLKFHGSSFKKWKIILLIHLIGV